MVLKTGDRSRTLSPPFSNPTPSAIPHYMKRPGLCVQPVPAARSLNTHGPLARTGTEKPREEREERRQSLGCRSTLFLRITQTVVC